MDRSEMERIFQAHRIHPLVLPPNYRRMHNAVQFLHSRSNPLFFRSAKREFGQFRSIHRPVGIQDLPSKVSYNLAINRFSRLHESVSNPVSLHKMRPQRDEHLPHNGLSCGDASRQPDFQHECIVDC